MVVANKICFAILTSAPAQAVRFVILENF